MKGWIKCTCFIISCMLTNQVIAQEIPSRTNDGVITTQGKANPKDVYAGMSLTREQQKQLQQMSKDFRQRGKTINEDSTLTQKEKRAQLLSLKQEALAKRSTILTAEQAVIYDQNIKLLKTHKDTAQSKSIVNNAQKNKQKDNNGLSRNSPKRTSKNKYASSWNNINLTKDQKAKIEIWNEDYRTRLQSIRYDGSLKQNQKQYQIEQLVREQDLELGNILTPEQKVIWNENQRQLKVQLSEREVKRNPRLYYMK